MTEIFFPLKADRIFKVEHEYRRIWIVRFLYEHKMCESTALFYNF